MLVTDKNGQWVKILSYGGSYAKPIVFRAVYRDSGEECTESLMDWLGAQYREELVDSLLEMLQPGVNSYAN